MYTDIINIFIPHSFLRYRSINYIQKYNIQMNKNKTWTIWHYDSIKSVYHGGGEAEQHIRSQVPALNAPKILAQQRYLGKGPFLHVFNNFYQF